MTDLPAGYSRVTPYLLYANAGEATRFLREAFGFEEVEEERVTDASGRVTHTAMKVIDQVILLGSPGPDFKAPDLVGRTVHIYIYVPDVDAHCERARTAGATICTEPEDAPYGDRRYAARDIEGHHWWFATRQG